MGGGRSRWPAFAGSVGLAVGCSLALACAVPSEPVARRPATAERVRTPTSVDPRADRSATSSRDSLPRGSAADSSTGSATPRFRSRWPAVERLVAIGDLHGDLEAARAALTLAGAIDASGRWAGGALQVVQTGDLLDRGDQELELWTFMVQLQGEAVEAGGRLHLLNGNHEYMNAAGDLRYVTAAGLRQFSRPGAAMDDPAAGRRAAFRPGSDIARQMASRPAILIVGDTVFAHGGVVPAVARIGVDAINEASMKWLTGETPPPEILQHPQGPVWSRDYATNPSETEVCAALQQTLDTLRVARMVVGHTVQKSGIQSRCGGRFWMIDVGMARFYGGRVQVLELGETGPRVLAAD